MCRSGRAVRLSPLAPCPQRTPLDPRQRHLLHLRRLLDSRTPQCPRGAARQGQPPEEQRGLSLFPLVRLCLLLPLPLLLLLTGGWRRCYRWCRRLLLLLLEDGGGEGGLDLRVHLVDGALVGYRRGPSSPKGLSKLLVAVSVEAMSGTIRSLPTAFVFKQAGRT
jgi:hypothetical protein